MSVLHACIDGNHIQAWYPQRSEGVISLNLELHMFLSHHVGPLTRTINTLNHQVISPDPKSGILILISIIYSCEELLCSNEVLFCIKPTLKFYLDGKKK